MLYLASHPFRPLLGVALVLCLAACGGGGGGTSSGGDVVPGTASTVTPTSGPDSFLLFPNPQKQDDGSLQTNAASYTTAYYDAIDPASDRDTLAKFKAKNGFGSGSGTEETVIVGDQRDLGYGRKMTARQNADGSLAFMVENYLVGGYGGYSSLNVEAAVNSVALWHVGTNGIEYSKGPGNTVKFVKFYTFDPNTGTRLTQANLDGRGYKAMPGICINCHGGRADPLTPNDPGTGKPLFAKLMNSASGERGDVGAQLHPFEPASFDFSTLPGFTRAMQEAKIKTINKMVLCSMTLPYGTATPTGNAEDDSCATAPAAGRRVATINEYQGVASAHLKDMYGGTGLPNAASNTTDTYVPAGWSGQNTLYLDTQAQSCRVCHLLRGTGNQSDIDFDTYTKFSGYADRIKAHVVDRGNMPLSKLINDKFWATSSIYGNMATFLTGLGYAEGNLKPGRPVADPGPDRVIKSSTATLSASMSLYSTVYQWTVTSGAATLTNATTATPTFTATGGNGSYTVQLVTGNGTVSSSAKTLTIVVDAALAWDPAALRFTDIKTILQAGGGGCTTCHQAGGNGATPANIPPIWYTNIDRNGVLGVEATNNKTDDDNHWFYVEVRGRINFTDIAASPLLRKPSGHHHYGSFRTGFNTSTSPGDPARVDYDKILGWILNGAPE